MMASDATGAGGIYCCLFFLNESVPQSSLLPSYGVLSARQQGEQKAMVKGHLSQYYLQRNVCGTLLEGEYSSPWEESVLLI